MQATVFEWGFCILLFVWNKRVNSKVLCMRSVEILSLSAAQKHKIFVSSIIANKNKNVGITN